ncbi:hypothetical protein ACJQWK_07956 [Exserohilum turcicum]
MLPLPPPRLAVLLESQFFSHSLSTLAFWPSPDKQEPASLFLPSPPTRTRAYHGTAAVGYKASLSCHVKSRRLDVFVPGTMVADRVLAASTMFWSWPKRVQTMAVLCLAVQPLVMCTPPPEKDEAG